eukprot:gene16210-21488_t
MLEQIAGAEWVVAAFEPGLGIFERGLVAGQVRLLRQQRAAEG